MFVWPFSRWLAMNLFLLSWTPEEAAEWHFDRHVVKMIIELAQLLSVAHWELCAADDAATRSELDEWRRREVLYRATHKNHPCARWVREHPNNYRFTCALAKALCMEYFVRFGEAKQHRHKTEAIIDHLTANEPRRWPTCTKPLIGPHSVTQPAQAMPDECKVDGDAIAAYRNYYCSEAKAHLTTWKGRSHPHWFVFFDAKSSRIAAKRKGADDDDENVSDNHHDSDADDDDDGNFAASATLSRSTSARLTRSTSSTSKLTWTMTPPAKLTRTMTPPAKLTRRSSSRLRASAQVE